MSFAMGKIVWPADGHEANVLLRGFMLKALEALDHSFLESLQEPIRYLEGYVSGDTSCEACSALAAKWKNELSEEAVVRDFQSEKAIKIRIVESVLGINEGDMDCLADELSWFTELLHAANVDYGRVRKIMVEYFDAYLPG